VTFCLGIGDIVGCRGKAVHDHTGLVMGCLRGEPKMRQRRGLGVSEEQEW